MRTILVVLAFLVGCLTADETPTYVSTCGPDSVVADCFKVSAYAAYIPSVRPTGATWDADGTGPDPYGVIYLNGEEIGRTTTLVGLPRQPSGPVGYFAFWDQAVAGVVLHVGDRIDSAAYDDSGYLILECGYALTALMLDDAGSSAGCFKEIGQFSTDFEPAL